MPFQLVHHWIRKAGKIVEEKLAEEPAKPRKIKVLEIDEAIYLCAKKEHKVRLLLIGEDDRRRNEVIT